MATIKQKDITSKINGITVDHSIPCKSTNYTSGGYSRNVLYVVMHYTGNSKDTAKANANYFKNNEVEASAHFFVDDTEIYQSIALKDVAWHCGTSGTYYHKSCRNNNSIGIEMCCTAGNYKISAKTIENAAYLCAFLCKKLGITASTVDTYVVRHYDVTHKVCPAQMVNDSSEWTDFKKQVKNILNTKNGFTLNKKIWFTRPKKVYNSKGKRVKFENLKGRWRKICKSDSSGHAVLKKGEKVKLLDTSKTDKKVYGQFKHGYQLLIKQNGKTSAKQ